MQEQSRRHSIVRLIVELVEQSIVLFFLELKLGALEIKRNLDSAKTGAVLAGLGAFLLLFSLLGVMATAIAALSLVLPVWLSALIVTAVLVFGGAGVLLAGLSKLKHFTIVPKDTVHRVENIGRKLKKHAEQRELEELEAREAMHAEAVEAREAARRDAEKVKESVQRARTRELTYARERARAKEEAKEERHAKRG